MQSYEWCAALCLYTQGGKWPGVTYFSWDLPGHHKYDPSNMKAAGIMIPAPQIHPGSDHDPGCFPRPVDALIGAVVSLALLSCCTYFLMCSAIMQQSCDPAGMPSHCPLCICTQSSLSLRTICVYTLACIAQKVSSNFKSILPVSEQIHTLTARYHKVHPPSREGLAKPSSVLCAS